MRGEHRLRYSIISIYRNRQTDDVFILELQDENSLKFRELVSRVRGTDGACSDLHVSKPSRCGDTAIAHLRRGRVRDPASAGAAWYDRKEVDATLPDTPEAEKAAHWKGCED